MLPVSPTESATVCDGCGAALAVSALACSQCDRIVHRARLEALARAATEASGEDAIRLWTDALTLLPEGSRQSRVIREKVAALRDAPTAPAVPASATPKWLGGLGALGVFLWKFKALLVLLLSKAKLVLLGLTKWKTALSMLLSLGVYWAAWGWPFALGFVLSIYVHEMGHVLALQHFGYPASAPMFVPGVGAFIRMREVPRTPLEDARIGLAGPVAGLVAALACFVAFHVTGAAIFAALARVGAWINVFNLIPIWQLDGARAFHGLSRAQRLVAAGAVVVAYLATSETMFLLVAAGAVYRIVATAAPQEGDGRGLLGLLGVLTVLSALLTVPVPGVGTP